MLNKLKTIAGETYLAVTTKLFPWQAHTLDTVAVAGSSVSKALGHIQHASDIDVFVLFNRMPDEESWARACEMLRLLRFEPSGTNGTYGMANWRLGPVNLIFDRVNAGRDEDFDPLATYLRSFDLPQHRAGMTYSGRVVDLVETGPFCARHATERTRLPRLKMARERYGVDAVVEQAIQRLDALVDEGLIDRNSKVYRNHHHANGAVLYAPYGWHGGEFELQTTEA